VKEHNVDYRYILADVFTETIFGGNQLAVLPDARGLTAERMQAITREFNLSETVFVLPPEDPGNTRRLRIFTPGFEVPFAGHPTVGTAYVLAAIGDVPLAGATTRIVFEEGVGAVRVAIQARGGRPVAAQLTAAQLPSAGPEPPAAEELARVLGLGPSEILADGGDRPAAYSAGVPFLFVPLRDQAAVDRARIDAAAWQRSLAQSWAPHVYVFAYQQSEGGGRVYSRMFAPAMNIPEDPATGAAAAALAGYLGRRDMAPGTRHWSIAQGVAMGRPSTIAVEFDNTGGAIAEVRVGGAAVLLGEGVLRLRE
jgi:trans-2,3-dihydro-3-hydroxyanthranilate isomerase